MTNKERRPVLPPKVTGILLRVLQFLAVVLGIFAWWAGMFLLISLFAVNIWSVTWSQILSYSFFLTAVCAIIYLVVMIRRERGKQGGAP